LWRSSSITEASRLDNRITDTNRRIDDTHRRIDDLRTDVNRRLTTIEGDLKQFFQAQTEFDKRFSRIEDKLGIPPR
jgi:hypothetical protein